MTSRFPCLRALARRLEESSSLAWPRYSRKENMDKQDAERLIQLAQAGAPVPEGVIGVALVKTGDSHLWSFKDLKDAEEFVDALRREGLL